MLETNATLPESLENLLDVIDFVSMDIKLPEHFQTKEEWEKVFENECKSIKLMEENQVKYYIKIVVSPTTPLTVINTILNTVKPIVNDEVEFIIQPVSPMSQWNDKSNLFKISELVGNYYNVSIIPQIHKYMEVE